MKFQTAAWRLIASALVSFTSGAAQQPTPAESADAYVKSHYTKYEYRVPVRDGIKLFTSVYVPKDQSQPWPILMDRTPYSVAPYGEDEYKAHLGPSDEFEKSNYIFVYQDVRGRYMSEGKFLEMTPHIDHKSKTTDVDDASDTYDTIEYLLKKLPNNNGKVGIWGISYPGFYTSASIIDSHPAIKAASPQAPMTNLFEGDDGYHGGAFMLAANFGFYTQFKPMAEPSRPPKGALPFDMKTPDGYAYFLKAGPTANLDTENLKRENPLFADQLYHDTYDDYWKVRDLSEHMNNVKCAVLVVGGYYDAEDLAGPWRTWRSIGKRNPATPNSIVEGPWVHGGWAMSDGDRLGDIAFSSKTAEFFRKEIQFPFFERYLKGKGAEPPKAYMFETGTNVWRKYDEWPPRSAQARTLYFHAKGKLSFDAPGTEENEKAFDSYLSDPAHPVPFVEYTTDTVPQRYMVDDQRWASRRPDVLTYVTDPLPDDLTIAGPISPKLKVTSSGTDSDFVVKLIDVYPDDYRESPASGGKRVLGAPPLHLGGYQELLRGEPMRAKFRKSWEKPEPLVPNKMTAIDFEMPDLHHTFRQGHRVMVQVQSSWFPLVDRNPQTFTDIPHARPEDFKPATERVYRSAQAASGVEILVLPGS